MFIRSVAKKLIWPVSDGPTSKQSKTTGTKTKETKGTDLFSGK